MNDDRMPTQEDCEAVGYMIGAAFCAMKAGFRRAQDEEGAQHGGVVLTGRQMEEEPRGKINIEDCRGCWCDTCANVERCGDVGAGMNMCPCGGCPDGGRYMPTESMPCCSEYSAIEGTNH